MDHFRIPIVNEMEDVAKTNPNPTPNTPPNPTPNTNTNPNSTPNTTPIELKSPKKEVDNEPLTNKKKPTRTSDIWDHFTKVTGGDPKNPRCKCNFCGADYACHSTRVGTSSLWSHLKKCKKNPERATDKKQKLLSFQKETDGGSNLLAVTFNKVRCRNALAKFVVKDEQAFKVVEGDGFRELVQELQPMFVVPSRVTIARDVLAIPVSTVASESAFSTSGRILDPFRSSLSPKMVEVLVCTQSWLRGQQGGLKLDGYLDETHSYEFLEEEKVNKVQDHATTSAEIFTTNINIIDE